MPWRWFTIQCLKYSFTTSLLVIFLLGLFPTFTQSSNDGPKITSLKVDETKGNEGEFFSFIAELADSKGDSYLYSWDFGDDTSVVNGNNLQAYKHRFKKEGNLIVTLTVADSNGKSDKESVNVELANVLPEIIRIDRIGIPLQNQSLEFFARVFDINDDLEYTWDFGDGITKGPIKNRNSVEHTYKKDGRYTLKLTVSDGTDEVSFTEAIRVGQGLEFTVSGDFNFSYENKRDEQDVSFTGLPVSTNSDGDLSYRLDLDSALSNEDATVGDGPCLVIFGNHPGFTEEEFYLRLSAAPHDILTKGTFPVLPKEDSAAGNPDNPYVKEIANPNAFFASVSYYSDKFDSGSTWFDAKSGTVEITYFDDNHIEASFDIDMIEFHSDTRLSPDHPLYRTRYRPPTHIQVNGRFVHNINHSLIKENTTDGDWYLCQSNDPTLQVVDHTPIMGAKNVDYERESYLKAEAKLEFGFSHDVELESLQDNVFLYIDEDTDLPKENIDEFADRQLRYKSSSPWWRLTEPILGEVKKIDNNRFRFIPARELLDGVHYRMVIVGGPNGVRSQSGATLENSYQWWFSTLVRPANIEAHVYQVIRDAKLVSNKPTLTRAYIHWEKKADIPDESQVEWFFADITIENDGKPIYKTEEFAIIRPDKFTNLDRRFALDSYNFFNWRPTQGTGNSKIEVTLEPQDQNRDKPKQSHSNQSLTVEYWNLGQRLDIDYYFLKVGDWKNGIPATSRQLGHTLVQRGGIFTTQNFPIIKTRLKNKGDLSIEAPSSPKKKDGDLYYDLFKGEYLHYDLFNDLYDNDQYNAFYNNEISTNGYVAKVLYELTKESNSDLIIGLVPTTLQPSLYGVAHFFDETDGVAQDRGNDVRRVVLLFINDNPSPAVFVHEVGHAFDLRHTFSCGVPNKLVCANAPRNIQGFKITPNGAAGWNKVLIYKGTIKDKTYNAEGNSLNQIMLSGKYSDKPNEKLEFIANEQYMHLFKTVYWGKFQVEYDRGLNFFTTRLPSTSLTQSSTSPILIASKQYVPLSRTTPLFNNHIAYEDNLHFVSEHSLGTFLAQGSTSTEYLLVTGFVDETSSTAVIEPLHFLETAIADESSGSYTLELQDSGGVALSSHAFEAFLPTASHGPPSKGPLMFNLTVPYNPKTDRIVVKQGENLLAERIRSPSTPEVSLLTPLPDTELQTSITWQSSDADGDELHYDLYYSPNGFDDWRPMAFGTRETSLDIDPSVLEPGPSPKLKLVASDGFNQTEVISNITLASEIQILASLPSEGESLDTRESIIVFFNTEFNPETFTKDSFVLQDEQGNTVEAELSYDQAARTAMLTPLNVLESLSTYKVTLSNLTDLYGNTLPENLSWSFETAEAVPTLAQIHQRSEDEADGVLAGPSSFSVSLPEICAGISSDLITPFVPEDSELVSINQDDGCQLEINSTLGFNSARAHVETTIIKNRYRLTQNTQSNDGNQSAVIAFENSSLLGKIKIEEGTPLLLNFKFTQP